MTVGLFLPKTWGMTLQEGFNMIALSNARNDRRIVRSAELLASGMHAAIFRSSVASWVFYHLGECLMKLCQVPVKLEH